MFFYLGKSRKMFPGVLFCTSGIEQAKFLAAADELVPGGKKAQGREDPEAGCLQLFIFLAQGFRDKEVRFPVFSGREVFYGAHKLPQKPRDMQIRVDDHRPWKTQLKGQETAQGEPYNCIRLLLKTNIPEQRQCRSGMDG